MNRLKYDDEEATGIYHHLNHCRIVVFHRLLNHDHPILICMQQVVKNKAMSSLDKSHFQGAEWEESCSKYAPYTTFRSRRGAVQIFKV